MYDILNDEFTTETSTLTLYSKNKMVKMATERDLITIGGAINRILIVNFNTEVSFARRIVQFRNKITDEYDAADDSQSWVIIRKYIPTLKNETTNLLVRR